MYQYIWKKKITSVVTLERTPSDASYQKYVALVALLFFIYLVNFIMLHCFPRRPSCLLLIQVSLQMCQQGLQSHDACAVTTALPFSSTSISSPALLSELFLLHSWNTSTSPSQFLLAQQAQTFLTLSSSTCTCQSIFSTFPIIFSSKMGRIASSSRISSNTTPQSNSSLTFLK